MKFINFNFKKKTILLFVFLTAFIFLFFEINQYFIYIYTGREIENSSYLRRTSQTEFVPDLSYDYACTIHSNRFILEAISRLTPKDYINYDFIKKFGDRYLDRSESALVFLSKSKNIAFIFKSRDKVFIDKENCLPSNKTVINIVYNGMYTDIYIQKLNRD